MDIVTAFHVVEHLSDPIKVLSELTNLLSKNGKLYIEVQTLRTLTLSK